VAPLELERPVPYPVPPPRGFRRALERGTRTTTGQPGPSYWRQYAASRISVSLDTQAKRVEASVRIRYRNNARDTLRVLALHLHQNLHQAGVVRNESQEITQGMTVSRVSVAGQHLHR
jgi:hypothetical protein